MMTREVVWCAAIDAGDRSMRAAGRPSWNDDDWNAMVREFNRLCPESGAEPLSLVDTPTLRAEINRRLAHKHPKHKALRACQHCGTMLGARERRVPCKSCGGRNPRKPPEK
jgi:hypothetical protein